MCRKLLAVHAAHKGASTRISRDKNRYKAGRYVPKGVTYTIAIEGVLDLMEILGYVEMTNKGRYSRDTGEGDQTDFGTITEFVTMDFSLKRVITILLTVVVTRTKR